MEEIKKVAIYGICATMIFRLTTGTVYEKYVKFFSGILLFSMIAGGILRILGNGETVLEKGIDTAWDSLYESVCLDADYDDIQTRSDMILEQITRNSGMNWEDRQEESQKEHGEKGTGIEKVRVEVTNEE